jgi:predicted acylesterase/phospholipase RssA
MSCKSTQLAKILVACLVLSIAKSTTSSPPKEKCFVLALEGGGDKGAYQSGAIKGLVENVPNGETQWDVVTGVSVGSMDAAAIAIFEIGKEKEAAEYLIDNWRNIKGKGDIYENWWGGPLDGLFFKTGLYSTSPLKKKLISIIKDSIIKRKFVCGATNFMTGEFETWDEETLYRDEYVDAIASSGSYPVIFPLNTFRGNVYMDGGVKINVDIASGINKCSDMGYADENIVVDVIMLNSKVLPEQDANGVHPLGVLNRVFEIFGYDNAMRDFEYAKVSFPKVILRYIITPTKKLPSGSIPLVFSPEQIETMIQVGYDDAKNVIKLGHGKNLETLLENYRQEKERTHGRGRRSRIQKSAGCENVKSEGKGEGISFLE